ncbi:MAG: ABC transporter substrate-binding protein [Microbacterium sp.]
MKITSRLLAVGAGAAALVLTFTSCSGSDSSSSDDSTTGLTTVRFSLDWTPNTNHTGLYDAIAKGYFEDAGIDLEILPYNDSYPDTLIDAGSAECGIGFEESTTVAQAAGADITTVMATVQHWATAIGVRADDDSIDSPADLDGKIYAGFGSATDAPMIATVIKDDGGTGEFTEVTLDTSAYEAVYNGEADFTIPFVTWEAIEAEIAGTPFKLFNWTDYGMPDDYAVLVNCNSDWLADNPETAAAFVQALQKGYEDAVADPDGTADILIDAAPDIFDTDEAKELVYESQTLLSSDYIEADDGSVGFIDADRYQTMTQWLFDNGLLTDENGDPLTEVPDSSTYFTNEYLASS